ncbi:MAG: helix-turn-helix domain-containing protein [Verrucomicrobia bacterium]|jgi:PTS system nitrogen regulatory IIA component|nr:helix-turn-helix domain-containing protein [Verrucomicrobiota bacterium]
MYLNIVELAESFGVEERVIQDWVRHEGLPHVPDRGRLRFDRAQVIAWAAGRGHAAKAGFLAAQQPAAHAGPHLEPLLRAGGIWRDVPADGVLGRLEQVVARLAGATPPVRQLLTQRLRASDGISWAPIGEGLAMPHLRVPVALGREGGVLALLLLREALEQPSLDSVPITRLLFFIAPSPRAHLEWLGQLSTALLRGRLKSLLLAGAPDDEILAALDPAADTRASEAPPP